MKKLDTLIIGAGAAGLMCAITAGQRGRSVIVIDHANKPGKKILMSGGGRCNFTNLDVTPQNFISHNPHFCKSALSRYTAWHFIDLVNKHQIPYHEKTLGQLFCDNKAKDIVNMLLHECDDAGAKVQLDTSIESIKQCDDQRFIVKTTKGDFDCESLVVACGGLSIPTMGATGFGYQVAEQFGLKVWPTRAGLVPFTLQPEDKQRLEPLAGVSTDSIASCNNTSFREGMLFTHRGLSGPSMLQISSYWNPGDELTVNLLPDMDVLAELKQIHADQTTTTFKAFFAQHLPKSQVAEWLDEDLATQTIRACSFKQLEAVAMSFQQWKIKPNGTEGYRTAEVTLGGVDCDAVSSKTFEAKVVKGLYFIGEVLDVTGWLGGYNFQWAWASGYAAGSFV